MEEFIIIGITNKFYVTEDLERYDDAPVVKKMISEKHKLYGYSKGKAICISLSEQTCSGGSCVNRYAKLKIKRLINYYYKFPSFSYTCEPLKITFCPDDDEIKSDAFEFSAYGLDEYYPSGYYSIHFEKFKQTPRYSPKRIVFLICGKSGIGKSFLADKLKLDVYETDSNHELPDVIYEEVVVIGNKYNYTIEDVKKRLFENPTVRVCKLE